MKLLGSDKKVTNVIMIAVATVAGAVLIWQFVIVNLQLALQSMNSEVIILGDEISRARNSATLLEKFKKDFDLGMERLKSEEALSVTQGDPYRWIINRLRDLQQNHNVEVTDFERPTVGGWKSFPSPEGYQQANFTIRGRAYFHDFGSFLAAMENELPFSKVKKLNLATSTGNFSIASGNEQLVFELQFVNPYKTASN